MRTRWGLVIKVTVGILILWALIFGIQAVLAPLKATPERVKKVITDANFEDFSEYGNLPDDSTTKQRKKALKEVAELVNRLDLNSQEEARNDVQGLWKKLAASEKRLFVDLTMESFDRFFAALDSLTPEARKEFLKRGMDELEDGETKNQIKVLVARDPELLAIIMNGGLRSYYQNASAQTKMDLAPVLQATNEVMQGVRGQQLPGGQF